LTDRPLDYGIKDYDLGYFDESDLSYDRVEDPPILGYLGIFLRQTKATNASADPTSKTLVNERLVDAVSLAVAAETVMLSTPTAFWVEVESVTCRVSIRSALWGFGTVINFPYGRGTVPLVANTVFPFKRPVKT
jgi:hypothetical protein